MGDEDDTVHCYLTTLPSNAEARALLGMEPMPTEGVINTPARPGDVAVDDGLSGGERVFLCGALGPPCVTCGDVADALCDFAIGVEARTCDQPICSRCSPVIGADKNYCIPHAANGPGMLLYARPPEAPPPRIELKPRLPRAPSELRRHRAVTPETFSGRLFWRVRSTWTDEFTARRLSKRDTLGRVQTWADFVAWHRAMWPLKTRPRQS